MPQRAPEVQVRRAADRFTTRTSWLESRHSFSFGPHYDPDNTHHGLLVVTNDDVVQPGTGFDTHPHRDMEIVTWVLQGSLVHQDSTGHHGVVYPGLAQRMSAGTGILHSERNDSWRPDGEPGHDQVPVHFVQMWVVPDGTDRSPGYQQREVADAVLRSGLTPVASGMARHADDAAVHIGNRHAALYAASLAAGEQVTVPDAPFVHILLAAGAATVEDSGPLDTGDTARLTAAGARRLTASTATELLIWEMHSAIGG
jgi:hypothetical protein